MGSCCSQEVQATEATPEVVSMSPKKTTIFVAILAAQYVRDCNWQPSSKCFLSCSVSSRRKDARQYATRQVKDSISPSWREEVVMKDYEEGNAGGGRLAAVPRRGRRGEALEFTLWESVGDQREVVGKASLEAAQFDPHGFCAEIPIEVEAEDMLAFLKVKVRCGSRDYLPEQPLEFPVTLLNSSRSPIGIEFDLQDGKTVHVMGLRGGLVEAYNKKADPDLAIRPGDFIMRVNKAEGNALEMLEALKADARLELLVRRPEEFVAAVFSSEWGYELTGFSRSEKGSEKGGATCSCAPSLVEARPKNTAHGMEFVGSPAGMSLVITKVIEGGPVEDWNRRYPEAEVRPGDRIVALDGEKGRAEDLLQSLKAMNRFQIHLARPAGPEEPIELAGCSKRFQWDEAGVQVKEYEVDG